MDIDVGGLIVDFYARKLLKKVKGCIENLPPLNYDPPVYVLICNTPSKYQAKKMTTPSNYPVIPLIH